MFADLNDVLWAKDLPHKQLLLTALYHLPGALVLGAGALFLRILIEEILRHIHQGLARHGIWTLVCTLLWLGAMLTTTASDTIARTILWDRIVDPPGAAARPETGRVPPPAPSQLRR
ncbi:MAG: hypothetical protein HY814_02650 [Candidatus Riflebacteria bacterium]|nr:hypothetical protein [Candidatus Riflebacteria bacterium]